MKKQDINRDDEGENFERKDEEDNEDENGVKRDLQNDVVGRMVRELSNQPDRSADYSSYDDKSRIESAVTVSYDDQ